MALRLGVVDLETTGLSQQQGHRIIEVGFAMFKTDNGKDFTKMGSTLSKRINPKREIDQKAFDVHGIALSDLAHCETWEMFAPKMGKLVKACDILVAHNAAFDLPFIGGEFERVGVDYGDCEMFCTMESGRFATAMGRVPSLKALCWSFGVEYDEEEAHSAAYDVDRTALCLFAGLSQGLYQIDTLSRLEGLALAS